MPLETLTPVPPAPGGPVPLGGLSPVWLGTSDTCAIQILLPGVAPRHVGLLEREDGWWATPGAGPATLNGVPLAGPTRLSEGDIVGVAQGYGYAFSTGAPAVSPPAAPAAARPPKRRKPKRPRPERDRRPIAVIVSVTGVVVLLTVAGAAIWWALFRTGGEGAVLSDEQAITLDSLLVVSYDHIERAGTLLELGLPDAAAQEFARGVNAVALSEFRNHPAVRPRIEALEASVGAVYRERRLAVPPAYAKATPPVPAHRLRAASLTPGEFETAFNAVQDEFRARFGSAIQVTGRDHAEHLSLYGPGGALDLRTRTLTDEQVQFVIAGCRTRGVRVKDFSSDSILRRQIRAATRAGLLDRAGTGLHLHIDRFAGRRDAWTVSLR